MIGSSLFTGTAVVQQVRQTRGVTQIWMNDGTVWEATDADAPLLASGDEAGFANETTI